MNHANFDRIPSSIEVQRPGKTILRFSCRNDYLKALIEQGLVSKEEDLVNNLELVAEIQQHWQHKTGQIGCRFAQLMSNNPREFGWHRIVVAGQRKKDWVDSNLGQHIESAIQDSNIAALSLIFPEIVDPTQLIHVVRYLAGLPRSSLEDVTPHTEKDLVVRLGLRIRLNDAVVAFSLAFGPFPELFPLTRQAPFTEIIFPVKPKSPPLRSGLTNDQSSAHLADVPLPITDTAWDIMMQNTKKLKSEILNRSHPGARAQVTISVPRRLWDETNEG